MANVVLIEDEPWLGELYRELLVQAGHRVQWCRDCYDGIELIDAEPPDAIILDLLLPWTNGIQLLHELASHADLAQIPVVLCTAAVPPHADTEVLAAYGVRAVLDKTAMQPQAVVTAIEGLLHADPAD